MLQQFVLGRLQEENYSKIQEQRFEHIPCEIFNKELVLRFLINIKDELQNSLKLFENFPKKQSDFHYYLGLKRTSKTSKATLIKH